MHRWGTMSRPLCSIDHVAQAIHALLSGNDPAFRAAAARAACDLELFVPVAEEQIRAAAERAGLVSLVDGLQAENAVLREGVLDVTAQAREALDRPVWS